MGNDSKLGMVIGLGIVVAVAFLAYPKAGENPTGGPASIVPTEAIHAKTQAKMELTSQARDAAKPITILPRNSKEE